MLKFRFLCLIPVIIVGCRPNTGNDFPKTITAEVTNPLKESRQDIDVWIPVADMPMDATFQVRSNEVQLAAEHIGNSIHMVLDQMKANEKRTITVYYNDKQTSAEEQPQYRKRTQAELSHRVEGGFRNVIHLKVPPDHQPHSKFIRYEGPGWESEKVAYRLYLDRRNAIDVFGKKTSDMVLMGVGQDSSASYHEMQPWGMDVMKTGESLGVGGIGVWDKDHVGRIDNTDSVVCEVHDGLLKSSITTKYFGWKTSRDTVDILSQISIHGGTRIAAQELSTTEQLCAGITKDNAAPVFKKEPTDNTWGYIATYGKQSLNNDNLGLVEWFSPLNFVAFHEDDSNHSVELKPVDGNIKYYFAAAWELEPNGIKNEADFIKWVEKSARELANPVTVHVK